MFVTFEGPEGAGKSTQARLLAERLSTWMPTQLIREPGSTPAGEEIRTIIMRYDLPPVAELFLFNAARACIVRDKIRPRLSEGYFVVCDRYVDSTYTIQGYGLGMPQEQLRMVCGMATEGLMPDITFFLDVPPKFGVARKGGDINRLDERGIAMGDAYRQGYHELMLVDPWRWVELDTSSLSVGDTHERIYWEVLRRYSDRQRFKGEHNAN